VTDAHQALQPGEDEKSPAETDRVGSPDTAGHRSGGQERGSSGVRAPQGPGGRQNRADAPTLGNNFRSGPPPRVSREGEIAAEKLLSAFEAGDPAQAYEAALALIEAHTALASEAARLRFRVNFSTSACDHCEGLKAGPGVVATCFQVRRCDYTNVKEGAATVRQLKVLSAFDSS